MNAGGIIGAVTVLAIFAIGIAALCLLLDVVFARWIRRARNTAERMPFRSGIVGAINLIFFAVITLALFAIGQETKPDDFRGVFQLLGLIVLLILSAFLAMGITASARWLGERIAPEANSARQILIGIITLELASLAPLVGWILVPLVTILVGYGAVIIALVWRREA